MVGPDEEIEVPKKVDDIVRDIINSYRNATPDLRVMDNKVLRLLDEFYSNSVGDGGKIDQRAYESAAHHFTKDNDALPILPYETLQVLKKYI